MFKIWLTFQFLVYSKDEMRGIMLRAIIICLALLFVWRNEIYAQGNEILNEIKTINHEMAQALIEGDSKKTLSYYTDDVISIPNRSEIMVGIEMIRRANAAMIAYGIKVTRFNLTTLKAFTCDSLITEIGYYSIALKVPGSARQKGETGKYVTIWQRQADGSLKIKAELWSVLPPDNMQEIY